MTLAAVDTPWLQLVPSAQSQGIDYTPGWNFLTCSSSSKYTPYLVARANPLANKLSVAASLRYLSSFCSDERTKSRIGLSYLCWLLRADALIVLITIDRTFVTCNPHQWEPIVRFNCVTVLQRDPWYLTGAVLGNTANTRRSCCWYAYFLEDSENNTYITFSEASNFSLWP